MKQPSWDQHEVALLIDAYMAIDRHPEKRRDVVIELSEPLRDMAEKQGRKIDKKYRNTNGINLRLMELKYLFSKSFFIFLMIVLLTSISIGKDGS